MATKFSALRRRPSPAMILAFTSLCIALAGNASALPGKDAVTKNDIRASAVGKSEIATNAVGQSEVQRDSIGQSELIEGDVTGLQGVKGDKGDAGPQGPAGPTGTMGVQGPPGPSTGPAGGDLTGSYPNPLIGPDAVGMSEIAPSAVGALEIAPDSVAQDEVENGGLDAADNKAAGVDNLDFGSIAANTCGSLTIDAGVSVEGDTVVTTPEESFSLQLSISTSDAVAANSFRVNVCNPTGAAVDPVGSEFSWVVFDN